MAILGQGSMRDAQKEQEHLASGDPKYQHLKQGLHLQIDSLADPAEAYYRMSHAIAEVQKCMAEISQGNMNNSGYGQPTHDGFMGSPPMSRGGPQMRGRGAGPSPGMGYNAPGYEMNGEGYTPGGGYGDYENGGGKMPMRGGHGRGRGDASRPYTRGRGGRP